MGRWNEFSHTTYPWLKLNKVPIMIHLGYGVLPFRILFQRNPAVLSQAACGQTTTFRSFVSIQNNLEFCAPSLVYMLECQGQVAGKKKKHQLVQNGTLWEKKGQFRIITFFPLNLTPSSPKNALSQYFQTFNISLFLYVFQWRDASCTPLTVICFMSVILSKWSIESEALDNLPPNSKINNWVEYHWPPIIIYHLLYIAVYVFCRCACAWEKEREREKILVQLIPA